jgi:transglutaminase-like putative cysteine protease
MRGRTCLALLVPALVGVINPARADSPGVRYSKICNWTISRRGKGFAATGRIRVDQTYLADHALRDDAHWISEYCDAEVSKVTAWCRGKRVSRDRIVDVRPILRDRFFNEIRAWNIDFPDDLRVGESIAYEYRVDNPDLNLFPAIEIPNLNYIDRYELRFKHPKQVRVEFDCFFPYGVVPHRVERSDDKTTALTFDSIPGESPIPYFEFQDVRAIVVPRFYDGDRLVNPVTPGQLSKWYLEMVSQLSTTGLAADSLILAWRGEARTQLDKLKLVYDYVRRNFRYVAEERRQHQLVPMPPSVVMANKYGDCKDRALLVQTLGRLMDVDVRLVPRAAQPPMAAVGLHPSLIDHVLCAYEMDTAFLFLDPTARYTPFGDLPESDVGREVIIVDSVVPRRLTVPPPSIGPFMLLSIEASLDSLDRSRARLELRGWACTLGLVALKESTLDAFTRTVEVFAASRLYKIGLDSLTLVSESEESLVLSGVADLSGFLVASPGRQYVPRVPFAIVDNEIMSRAADSLEIHFSSRDAYWLQITLAASGYAMDPGRTSLGDAKIASFSAEAALLDSGLVRLTYEYVRQPKTLGGQVKNGFLQFCRDYLNEKKNMFVLERASQ